MNFSDLSQNAVLAKARAMYAGTLTNENYVDLANCRTINEAANYLKGRTSYSEAFVSVPNVKIHRARLEAVLKRYMLSRIASLCSFEKAIGQNLYEILLLRNDVDCIITCADYLDSDNIGEYLLFVPDFFKEHSELTMLPLERARNFDELLSGLHGTRYESIIKKAMNGKTEFSVQLLENVLYNYLYTEASSIICEKYKKGKKRDELLDVFRMRSDMKTIESIYRLKKYYGSGSDVHTGSFFNSGITSFSEKELASLLAASSPDEVLELLKKTRYGKYLPAGDMVIERKTAIMQLRINEKQLRYSTHPETVFLSYIGIMENEMQNVTHIIEGIRYSLPPEEIMKYLIKSDDK